MANISNSILSFPTPSSRSSFPTATTPPRFGSEAPADRFEGKASQPPSPSEANPVESSDEGLVPATESPTAIEKVDSSPPAEKPDTKEVKPLPAQTSLAKKGKIAVGLILQDLLPFAFACSSLFTGPFGLLLGIPAAAVSSYLGSKIMGNLDEKELGPGFRQVVNIRKGVYNLPGAENINLVRNINELLTDVIPLNLPKALGFLPQGWRDKVVNFVLNKLVKRFVIQSGSKTEKFFNNITKRMKLSKFSPFHATLYMEVNQEVAKAKSLPKAIVAAGKGTVTGIFKGLKTLAYLGLSRLPGPLGWIGKFLIGLELFNDVRDLVKDEPASTSPKAKPNTV